MGAIKYASVISLMLLFMNVLNSLCEKSKLNIDISSPELLDSGETSTNDLFGASIALSQDDVFIGAPNHSYSGGVFHCKNARCEKIEGFQDHGL